MLWKLQGFSLTYTVFVSSEAMGRKLEEHAVFFALPQLFQCKFLVYCTLQEGILKEIESEIE